MKIKPDTNNINLTRKIFGLTNEFKKKRLDVIEEKPLTLFLNDQEISDRKNKWQPRKTNHNSGSIWKYAQTVGPAHEGAVTQPGAKNETHTYADI